MNLLSSLVLSSFVFSSLVLSLLFRLLFSVPVFFLSLSFSVWCCGRNVLCCVVLRVLTCACVTVRHASKLRVSTQHVPVCTGTTRTRWNTCARGAGTNGEVLNVHTETFFISKTSDFWHFFSVLNGCWVHLLSTIFCLPCMAHIWVITCFRGSTKKPLRLYPFKVWA